MTFDFVKPPKKNYNSPMSTRFQKNISLKKYTTSRVGGPARYFCKTKTVEELKETLSFARNKSLPILILGGGSNLLIADEGFPGVVIKNEIKNIIGIKQILKAGSGTLLSKLVNLTVARNLKGLEKLIGIPGTLGGAIFGNAGAYGTATGDVITKVVAFDPGKNKIISLNKKQCRFGYRDSAFKRNGLIILEAHFKLIKTRGKILKQEAEKILKDRLSKKYQEGGNPGSFFKNILVKDVSQDTLKLIPKDKIIQGKIPAGFLLESVGAKGMKVGKIQVSKNHANLLINTGEGKASDFFKLAKILAKKVKEKYGIKLEPEVQLINLPPFDLTLKV